jgi:hypothetical protein
MKAPPLSDVDLELQRCDEEARRLEQQLSEARDLPKKMAQEQHERDNTLPPCERLVEIKRLLDYEAGIITRREAGNWQRDLTRSVWLVVALVAAFIALLAWGFRLLNG